MKAAEVRVEETWRTLGMRGTGSDDVVIDGLYVPDAAVAFTRRAGEWHPVFRIIATIAFPPGYTAYLGVAESAHDRAVALDMRKPPSHPAHDLAGRREPTLAAPPPHH